MKIRKELAVLAQYSCDLPLLWSKKYSDLFACCEESLHFLHINQKKKQNHPEDSEQVNIVFTNSEALRKVTTSSLVKMSSLP